MIETNYKIAKFWSRIFAATIDLLLLVLFGYLLVIIFQNHFTINGILGNSIGFTITVLYFTLFNSNLVNGQTIGKKLLNIHVIDINSEKLSLKKSFYRSLFIFLPFFLNNFTIPIQSILMFLNNFIKTFIVIYSTSIPLVYIINRKTRQSVYDLLLGSLVVDVKRSEEPVFIENISKKSLNVVGSILIVLSIVILFNANWHKPDYKNSLTLFNKLYNIDGITKVWLNTKYLQFPTGTTTIYEVKLWVDKLPEGYLEDNKVVKEVVKLTLANNPDFMKYDKINIVFIKEFNIGIAYNINNMIADDTPQGWMKLIEKQ